MKNTATTGKEIDKTKPDYYYTRNGLMVFTENYHLKRGYCCKSGCKHCPYGFKIFYNV